MDKQYQITASIVLFNQDKNILKTTIDSFLKTNLKKRLYLIDNGSKSSLKTEFNNPEIEYILNDKNIGFGKAHNLVLNKINSDFHLILNPDVIFNKDVLPKLILKLNSQKKTSFISPKVLYPNKRLQYVCRKHPTFFDLLNRKLKISKNRIFENEYRNLNYNKSFYPEFIHGCFMLFKTKDFIDLKGFDERYFLYMEDADICKKIDNLGNNKLYFPEVEVIHVLKKGSSKSINLFFKHTYSAIKYFLKWGF